MMKFQYLALSLGLCGLLAACGGDDKGKCGGDEVGGGSLKGSYCENHPMEFERVAVRLQSGLYSITYETDQGSGREKTLQLIWTPPADLATVTTGKNFDATDSVQVRRVLGSGSSSLNADLTKVELRFDQLSKTHGAKVKGSFGLRFKSGRALGGTFDTQLQVVADPSGG